MYRKLGDDYKFVATIPTDEDRIRLGYHDMNKQYPFVLASYESENNFKEAMKLALTSDVIITGSAPEIFTSERVKLGKLTFRYYERVYKKGLWSVLLPRYLFHMVTKHTRYINKNLYMLCASAYTAGDFSLMGAYRKKTYKWGYFTEVKKHDIDELLRLKNQADVEILWAGRFLRWKHPEKAVYVAKRLKNDGYSYNMKMIGIGERERSVKKLIDDYGLSDRITLLGAMPPENVRIYMEHADIFLFTSDYNEGWGAVLNEAMNSGCAVVASHAAGAAPFMVKHGENGLVYKNNNDNDLYIQTKALMDNRDLRDRLGRNAFSTLCNEWNAERAANSFISLCESLLRGDGSGKSPESGPCSVATPLAQHKVYDSMISGVSL